MGASPRTELAKIALAAWVNVEPHQLPEEKMWIEHPNDDNRQGWDRVIVAVQAPVLVDLEEARAVIGALIDQWPEGSLPSGPLCVRAARVINASTVLAEMSAAVVNGSAQ